MVIPIRMGQYLPMFPRSAVVTGGASGIGEALVTLLQAEGADVQTLDLADGFVRSLAPQLAQRDVRINAVAPGFVDTPLLGEEGRARFVDAGFPLLRPDDVGRAILTAARSNGTGQIWIVQPGREAEPFRFPKIPGPRDPSGAAVGLPPS